MIYLNISKVDPLQRYIDRTVLITGGTSGIGLQIAKQFLAEGANVIITSRSDDNLNKTVCDINDSRFKGLKWDISDDSVRELNMKKAVEIFGKIDIFVNNAGIYDSNSWDKISAESYDKVQKTNTRSLFLMSQLEGEYFVNNKIAGKILNITSIAGLKSGFDPYSISKWGATCITKGLAKDLIPYGIIVNGIAPGNVVTNIHNGVRGKDVYENAYMPSHLTKRYTLIEEIADTALFLCSGAVDNIVGQIITIDGGWTLN